MRKLIGMGLFVVAMTTGAVCPEQQSADAGSADAGAPAADAGAPAADAGAPAADAGAPAADAG